MSNLERSPTLTRCGETEVSAPAAAVEELTARLVDLGEGTPVRRLLPNRGRSTIGAWCFADHFGPEDIAGRRGMRVPPHPHIGLQTVTWLLEGEVLHRDSLGNEQLIRPGELNLMTAGRGIAHSEESPAEHPPVLHGVQLWVALPRQASGVEPAFEHLARLPVLRKGGSTLTVLVGELAEARSPAVSYSPLLGVDVAAESEAEEAVPLRADFEHGVMAIAGEAIVEGVTLRPGALVYLAPGRTEIAVRTPAAARLLLLGGEPFDEAILMWWNFVGHSDEEIAQARADWESGARFGEVKGFDGLPLPAPPLPPGRLKPRRR